MPVATSGELTPEGSTTIGVYAHGFGYHRVPALHTMSERALSLLAGGKARFFILQLDDSIRDPLLKAPPAEVARFMHAWIESGHNYELSVRYRTVQMFRDLGVEPTEEPEELKQAAALAMHAHSIMLSVAEEWR